MTDSASILGFNGEAFDPVSGTYHLGNGYRTYSPVLKQFLSPDSMSPFGAGGINPCAYCAGDPVNHCDPSGHFHISFMSILGVAGVIGGLAAAPFTGGSSLALAAALGGAVLGAVSAGTAIAAENTTGSAHNMLAKISLGTGIAGGILDAASLAGPALARNVGRLGSTGLLNVERETAGIAEGTKEVPYAGLRGGMQEGGEQRIGARMHAAQESGVFEEEVGPSNKRSRSSSSSSSSSRLSSLSAETRRRVDIINDLRNRGALRYHRTNRWIEYNRRRTTEWLADQIALDQQQAARNMSRLNGARVPWGRINARDAYVQELNTYSEEYFSNVFSEHSGIYPMDISVDRAIDGSFSRFNAVDIARDQFSQGSRGSQSSDSWLSDMTFDAD